MLAQMRWKPKDADDLTLREVIIFYDNTIVHEWDHTASLLAMIHNSITVNISINSKARPPAKGPIDFHPYRKRKRKGVKLNKSNFNVLFLIAEAMSR